MMKRTWEYSQQKKILIEKIVAASLGEGLIELVHEDLQAPCSHCPHLVLTRSASATWLQNTEDQDDSGHRRKTTTLTARAHSKCSFHLLLHLSLSQTLYHSLTHSFTHCVCARACLCVQREKDSCRKTERDAVNTKGSHTFESSLCMHHAFMQDWE